MMLKDSIQNHETISSDRVEGTNVYGSDDAKIGSVECVMIEKTSGQAKDCVVNVGGFLGMGSARHNIPWSKFDYNEDLGGYKLDVTQDQLKEAPSYEASDRDERMYDNDYRRESYEYWGEKPYW